MRLPEFLTAFADAIADAVVRTYPPVYDADTRRSCGFDLRRLLRKPLVNLLARGWPEAAMHE